MVMTKIVGILNITPDSFYDGGKFLDKNDALEHALHMIESGADIIELGAESTKPDVTPISQKEEIRRLDGILQEISSLCKRHGVIASLDSYNPETVAFGIDNGITFINAQKNPEEVAKVLVKKARTDIPLVVMHALTVPVESNANLPNDTDVMEVLKGWFTEKLQNLTSIGMSRKNIIIDPGLGCGKTNQQCYTIIKNIEELRSFSLPIFIGHSNKRFVAELNKKCEGVNFTLPISSILFTRNIEYIRVHSVKEHHLLRSHVFES